MKNKIKKKAFRDTSKIKAKLLNEFGITKDMSESEIEQKLIEWMRKEYIEAFNTVMKEE